MILYGEKYKSLSKKQGVILRYNKFSLSIVIVK